MPTDAANTKNKNKKINPKKKTVNKPKAKSKAQPTVKKENKKNFIQHSRYDFNQLTEANISSLRWENVFNDPIKDQNRIETYKELRRQRYTIAREKAIQELIQRLNVTVLNGSDVQSVV